MIEDRGAMTTTSSHAQRGRRLGTPGRPTAAVLCVPVALLAVLIALALIELFTAPLPPAQHGPFGGLRLLTGMIALFLLVLAPLATAVGFVAAIAEAARVVLDSRTNPAPISERANAADPGLRHVAPMATEKTRP